jgi:hypothetical protein
MSPPSSPEFPRRAVDLVCVHDDGKRKYPISQLALSGLRVGSAER